MTNLDIIEAIRTRFLVQWNDATEVVLDNEAAIEVLDAPWAKLSIAPVQDRRVSIGAAPIYERYGSIYITIFVPQQEGDETLLTLTDSAIDIFRDWVSADHRIRTEAANYNRSNVDKWHCMVVKIDYSAR